MLRLRDISKQWWTLLIVGAVLGAVIIIGLRAVLMKDTSVHYHADFALYINGQRDEFNGPGFYQEVQVCSAANAADNPLARAHLHDNNNHLVHVHARGVTWSQLFANLGYSLGDKQISTETDTYTAGQNGNQLTFILNGRPVDNIANKVIGDRDVLLIDYGQANQKTLQQRYMGVPRDAVQADNGNDPSACSGSHKMTLIDRFKHAVTLTE